MRLEGQYDPRADIAWLRVDDQDDGTPLDEARDALRAFSEPSGRTVAVRHARRNLPTEFLKMLRQVPGAAPQARRVPRHSSGLAPDRRLKHLHDAWG